MHFLKWLYPGIRLKRWLFLFSLGVIAFSIGLAIVFNYQYAGNIEEAIFRMVYRTTGQYYYAVTTMVGTLIVLAGSALMLLATRRIVRSVVEVMIPEGTDSLIELIFQKRKLNKGPAVAVIGGGTGLSVLLRGIKGVTSNITAIVTVADDGGSSGRLRRERHMIPPGDLRNCLVALAETEPLMEKLFQHRFKGEGDLGGHSFGNLFLAAMTEVVGDTEQALKEASKVLAVKGKVLPSTLQEVRLVAEMADGSRVEGESAIPKAGKKISRILMEPAEPMPVAGAIEAIAQADAIVLGPGSLYTSVIPNLLVAGVADALRSSKAVKIYICNVMTQPGETDGYSALDHVRALIEHGGEGIVDYVIVNTQTVAEEQKERYDEQGAQAVLADFVALKALGVKVVGADIISEADLVRHDPLKLCRVLMNTIYKCKPNPEGVRVLDYYLLGNQLKNLKKKGGKEWD